jgi:high affinity Mn2+ porin
MTQRLKHVRDARMVPAKWCSFLLALAIGAARAAEPSADETAAADWSVHAQLTGIVQSDPGMHSPYQGPRSLSGDEQTREIIDGTLYLGRRLPWSGGELYFNPEFNQGSGLSHTVGIEDYPNGEAGKAGFDTPKPNVARLFLRQTFGLGGAQEAVADDQNALAGMVDVSRLVVTAGKFAANDIFDDNQYAHDSRTQFLSWSLWEATAWDYPADAKGYSDGLAVELNQPGWALRGGWFLMPKIGNERDLDPRFVKRFGSVVELETRHEIAGAPGKLRTLIFLNRAPMGSYDQALALANSLGAAPDITLTRRDRWKIGAALNLEQGLTETLGLFARLSWNDGRTEGWNFTDINRSLSAGVSLTGKSWGRDKDTLGLGAAVNAASKGNRNYLAAGGVDILAGDGRLNYAPEAALETYYSFDLSPAALTLDYQFVANPAFNQDRGPVSILAMRIHLAF